MITENNWDNLNFFPMCFFTLSGVTHIFYLVKNKIGDGNIELFGTNLYDVINKNLLFMLCMKNYRSTCWWHELKFRYPPNAHQSSYVLMFIIILS